MDSLIKNDVLQGANFQLESSKTPKMQSGGSSSSEVLNKWTVSVAQDISLITTYLNKLILRVERIENITTIQGAAYVGMFDTLATRIDAASGYSQVLADMRSSFYVNEGDTTATIDKMFGQATLPVSSSEDLLVTTDVYGNKYISETIEFSYLESPLTSPPNSGLFINDREGLNMIRGDQAWLHTSQSNKVYVKLKAPLTFKGLLPNVLEIWPLPIGALKLKGIWYQIAGVGADGTWNELDISYLPQYSSSDEDVPYLGPIKIHLPNVAISQITFALDVSASRDWGLRKLLLKHVEYSSPALLVVKDPYNRIVGDTLLRGKDPADLAELATLKNSNELEITLTSNNTGETPVITGVILSV